MIIPGIFSQRDNRWGSAELGYNTDAYYNIYHFGCAITAASNIIWWCNGDASWAPDRINDWLKGNAGYQDGGGLLIWASLSNLLQSLGIVYHGYTENLADTNMFLMPDDNFALAQLTKPGFPMHFSAMPYVNTIGDSWDAVLKPVTSYTFQGAHLYSKTAAVVVPPVIIPAPVQPPVAPPLPDPTPAPVPTNTEPQPEPVAVNLLSDTPSGHFNADSIPITVVPPLVSLPEFEDTYKAFDAPEHLVIVEDTAAIDMTAQNAPKHFTAGTHIMIAGEFTDGGQTYYRGTSGSWYGVPKTAFETEGGSPTINTNFDPLALVLRAFGSIIALFHFNK